MTGPVNGASLGGAAPPTPGDRLRAATHDFEAVFITQLFREMRATVPVDEAVPGQEMFTGLLDEAVAAEAARRSTRGLGEALYRQLAARLGEPAAPDGRGDGNGTR